MTDDAEDFDVLIQATEGRPTLDEMHLIAVDMIDKFYRSFDGKPAVALNGFWMWSPDRDGAGRLAFAPFTPGARKARMLARIMLRAHVTTAQWAPLYAVVAPGWLLANEKINRDIIVASAAERGGRVKSSAYNASTGAPTVLMADIANFFDETDR